MSASKASYLIAYSGGLDSHVLLHQMALKAAKNPTLMLRALHVHHGLHPNADAWATHCQTVCADLSIPIKVVYVSLPHQTGDSLEALARQERYRVLAEYVLEGEIVLTAHHQDDQVETLLLQLMRGAGPRGLSAMPKDKPLGRGRHQRPLLQRTRAELETYAKAHQLQWIEDDSNKNQSFDRNYIRHTVLPVLTQRWPCVLTTLARSARHCAQAEVLLADCATDDLSVLGGTRPNTLSVNALRALSEARRHNALRYWSRSFGAHALTTEQLKQCERQLLESRWDAQPALCIGRHVMRRYRDDLYYLPTLTPVDRDLCIAWDAMSPLSLPGDFAQISPRPEYCDLPTLSIRFRQGGERLRLSSKGRRQTLKHCFREWNIPPWERNRIPLLYSKEQLIAVLGFFEPKASEAVRIQNHG